MNSKWKFLRVTAISALAVMSVGYAVAQTYTATSNDLVRLVSANGSYAVPNFFAAVATAVAADNAVATNPCVATAPSVSSGFGTNSAVTKSGSNCAFSMTSGTTAASNGVIALPNAPDGWTCAGQDVTTSSNAIFMTKETAETVNTVTLDGFQSNGAVGNWVANDVIVASCQPF